MKYKIKISVVRLERKNIKISLLANYKQGNVKLFLLITFGHFADGVGGVGGGIGPFHATGCPLAAADVLLVVLTLVGMGMA